MVRAGPSEGLKPYFSSPIHYPHQPYHYRYRIGINKYVKIAYSIGGICNLGILKPTTEHWGRNLGCA